MQEIVKLHDIGLTYHSLDAETKAIEKVSLSIYNGEFVAIVGPSGCGKSTILSIIAGLFPASSGTVELLGSNVTSPRDEVGYMLQRDHLFDWRTIWKNVLVGLEVRHKLNAQTRTKASSLLESYGLGDFSNHYPRELSGGMRQKAALIRTLTLDPILLLLDEPFSALDYQTRLSLCDEIATIIRKEGKTAILVTHDIAEAISIADRVIIFSKRPATIKKEVKIDLPKVPPLERRNMPGFQNYFEQIWKEIDVNV